MYMFPNGNPEVLLGGTFASAPQFLSADQINCGIKCQVPPGSVCICDAYW